MAPHIAGGVLLIAAIIALLPLMATADTGGPLAHYSFDSAEGDRVFDTVGTRHGAIEGATWKPTALGHGLHFDGVSDYVSLGDDPAFRFTGSFSVALWVRHDSIEGWQDYVGNYVGGVSGFVLAQNEGYLYFHQGGLQPYTLETAPLLHPGTWHHVAAVYDNQAHAMRLYVDGMEQASQIVTGTPKPATDVSLYIGQYHEGRELFRGIMDELSVWDRAISEAEVMALCGEHQAAFGADAIEVKPEPLPEGVLMGMGLESADVGPDGFHIVTTGSQFRLAHGTISCSQRIPLERTVTCITLPDDIGPLTLEGQTDFACKLTGRTLDVTVHGDSLLILRAKTPQRVSFRSPLQPEYRASHNGSFLFIDETGGFGIYPTRASGPPMPDTSRSSWRMTWDLAGGEEMWVSVFPPRPYNYQRSFESLAHEGMEEPDRWYPSDDLIEQTARHCKVLTIHSYIFPGGEKAPWLIPRFQPADINRWHEVRQKIQGLGMKIIPYFSPFYYKGSLELTEGGPERTYFDEIRHALDELKVDGIYFDGVSMDFRTSYRVTRKVRQMIGDDRILYVHCSSDPLGRADIYCPFIDTYADYTLRGEAGRGGLDRDTFLRYIVGGYNIGNAVGLWCYYGSTGAAGYVNVVPPTEDIDACLAAHARLWRQGMYWSDASVEALAAFDAEYYRKVDALRREYEAGVDN